MTEAFIFITTGLVLLGLLARWVYASGKSIQQTVTPAQVQDVLTAVHVEMPPPEFAQRIFAREDLELAKQYPRNIQNRFLNDRKQIALAWLAQTQTALRELMSFHRKAARSRTDLRPETELRLAFSYLCFIAASRAVQVTIHAFGPFAAQTVVNWAQGMADQLSCMSAHVLSAQDSAHLSRVRFAASRG
jgi:hypothetical protein